MNTPTPSRRTTNGAARVFDYIYDFGDDWHHAIVVEQRELISPDGDIRAINARLRRIRA